MAYQPIENCGTVEGGHVQKQRWLVVLVAGSGTRFQARFIILTAINSRRHARFTGVSAGIMVATYIPFEAPLPGMSINPARTLASAAPSGVWEHAWVYFTAPLLGTLAGAELYRVAKHAASVKCAKLDYAPHKRCIHCGCEPGPQPLPDNATTSESYAQAAQATSVEKTDLGHGRNAHAVTRPMAPDQNRPLPVAK